MLKINTRNPLYWQNHERTTWLLCSKVLARDQRSAAKATGEERMIPQISDQVFVIFNAHGAELAQEKRHVRHVAEKSEETVTCDLCRTSVRRTSLPSHRKTPGHVTAAARQSFYDQGLATADSALFEELRKNGVETVRGPHTHRNRGWGRGSVVREANYAPKEIVDLWNATFEVESADVARLHSENWARRSRLVQAFVAGTLAQLPELAQLRARLTELALSKEIRDEGGEESHD